MQKPMDALEKYNRNNNRIVGGGVRAVDGRGQLLDGAARLAAQPHAMRLVSTHDGSPLRNKVKVSRNSPCPCNSGKKFKNCHQKSL